MQIYTCDKSQLEFTKSYITRVYRRLFKHNCDLTPVYNFIPTNDIEKAYLESVNTFLDISQRNYVKAFDSILIDTHHDLEKLGIGHDARKYTLVISLEDSLDYILAYICKCDVKAVRSISNYKTLSKGLLSAYYAPQNFNFNSEILRGLDANLDKYLENLYYENKCDPSMTTFNLHKQILETGNMLLRMITGMFKLYSGAVIRSLGSCSSVLTSDKPYEGFITLENKNGIPSYTLQVGCFERYSYINNAAFEWTK